MQKSRATENRPASQPPSAQGRRGLPILIRGFHGLLIACLLAGLAAPPALAAPKGEKTRKGKVRVSRKGNLTKIKASNGAIIGWTSFDIGKGEKVKFIQPGRLSRVLNRVSGDAPTQIDGHLQANGQIYIANPSGVYLNGRAQIEVSRLVGAAGQLSDADFSAGRDRFSELRGEVVNRGSIEADSVQLLGRRVANHGRIATRGGEILMAAGDEIWLAKHDSHVLVKLAAFADPERDTDTPAVENTGVLRAGRARLAAGDWVSLAVRNRGDILAREISLEGGKDGVVDVAGHLDASNLRDGQRGGQIDVFGDYITVHDAVLSVSGAAGGGSIRVGGDVQGSGGTPRARGVYIDPSARLHADALYRGDGGKVVVWSDESARVHGRLSARGGEKNGDGGFIETSGLRYIDITRAADVSAENGEGGTWLIDPIDVEITDGSKGTLDDIPVRSDGGSPPQLSAIFQPEEGPSSVSNTAIVSALEQGANVIVTTDQFRGEGDDGGNITVNGEIRIGSNTPGNGASLTLLAANSITVNETISAAGSGVSLDVNLIANDNKLMPLDGTPPDGQQELGQADGANKDNINFERGDLTIEDGVSIETGGGRFFAQGVQVEILEDGAASGPTNAGVIDTDGGALLILAVNPRNGSDRLRDNAEGDLLLEKAIDVRNPSPRANSGGGTINIKAGGTLTVVQGDAARTGADIIAGDLPVALDGRQIDLQGTVETDDGDVQIGRNRERIGRALFRRTRTSNIDAAITTDEGRIEFAGQDLQINADVTSAEARVTIETETLTIGAVTVSADGALRASVDQTIELNDSVLVSGGRLELESGLSVADDKDEEDNGGPGNPEICDFGDLCITGGSLHADEIVLHAGDGTNEKTIIDPNDPRVSSNVLMTGTLLRDQASFDPNAPTVPLGPTASNQNTNPDSLEIIQDAALDGSSLPTLAQFGARSDGMPLLADLDYLVRSHDANVRFDAGSVDRVEDSNLKVIGRDAPEITAPLQPEELELRIDDAWTVDNALAANLKPKQQLQLHSGSDGRGLLDFEAGVILEANEIWLRSGDGNSGKKVGAVDISNVSQFLFPDGGAGSDPNVVAIRQDAAIEDADIPAASQYPGGVAEVQLQLRSDDGGVTIETPSKVMGTELQAYARKGKDLTLDPSDGNPFTLESADLGGVLKFEVTQALLDQIDIQPAAGGDEILTLRAGLGGSGELSFERDSQVQVQADQILLVASDLSEGSGTGNVDVNNALFLGSSGSGTSPKLFSLRQDAPANADDVPRAEQFGGGQLPAFVAIRVDESTQSGTGVALEFDRLDRVRDSSNNTKLLLVADSVAVRSDDDEDLDFTTLASEVQIEGNSVTLEASRADPGIDSPLRVDASSQLALSGYDSEDQTFEVDITDPDLGRNQAGTSEASSPDSFTINQGDDIDGSLLPTLASFEDGLDRATDPDLGPVAYVLNTNRGGIDLDATARDRVVGSDLEANVLRKPRNATSASDRTITFGAGNLTFDLNSFSASSEKGMTVTAGTTLNATESIVIAAAGNGKKNASLTFESGVSLNAQTIELSAGNGSEKNNGGSATAPIVDAGTNNPIFTLTNANLDDDDETRFTLTQDGDITGSSLPSSGSVSDANGTLGLYEVETLEGSIDIDDLSRMNALEVRLIAASARKKVKPVLKIEETGDLDIAAALPDADRILLRSRRIRLRSDSSIIASDPALDIQGLSGSGSAPLTFQLSQDSAIDPSTDHLPSLSSFGGNVSNMTYRLKSTQGDVTIDSTMGARLAGSNLELVSLSATSTPTDVTVDSDLDLRSLVIKADEGRGAITLGDGDASEEILTIKTVDEQFYGGEVTTTENARLTAYNTLFRDDILGPGRLAIKTRGDSTFGGDLGSRNAPLREFVYRVRQPQEAVPTLEFDRGVFSTPAVPLSDDGGGTRIVTTGDILINKPGLEETPVRATLIKPSGNLKLESLNGDIVMGRGEKISVPDGDLRLRAASAGARVAAGDLTTTGTLRIVAPILKTVARDGDKVLNSDGTTSHDSGVDMQASKIRFDVDRIRVKGDGGPAVLAIPDPFNGPRSAIEIPEDSPVALVALYRDGRAMEPSDLMRGSRILDGRARGISASDLARSEATIPPRPSRALPLSTRAPENAKYPQIGISVRPLTAAEQSSELGGAGLVDDSSDVFGETRVASTRLLAPSAERATELRRQLFGANDENVPRLQAVLQKAVDDFLRDTQPRRVVGFEFRRYVKNRPSSQFAAYQTLEDLDDLFRSHRNTGLSPGEFQRTQISWLESIAPEGITARELGQAVHPTRYVRGSDILDIFGE